jgi:hypothetical protein
MTKGLIIVKLAVGSSNPNLTPLSFLFIEDNELTTLVVRGMRPITKVTKIKQNNFIINKRGKISPHLAC